jgi:hypothetical protein
MAATARLRLRGYVGADVTARLRLRVCDCAATAARLRLCGRDFAAATALLCSPATRGCDFAAMIGRLRLHGCDCSSAPGRLRLLYYFEWTTVCDCDHCAWLHLRARLRLLGAAATSSRDCDYFSWRRLLCAAAPTWRPSDYLRGCGDLARLRRRCVSATTLYSCYYFAWMQSFWVIAARRTSSTASVALLRRGGQLLR